MKKIALIILLLIIVINLLMSKKEGVENTNSAETYQGCIDNAEAITNMQMYNPETDSVDNVDISELNAKEMCQKISSRAEEIEKAGNAAAAKAKAEGEAGWGPFNNLTAWMNPNNYKGGNSKSEKMMRNILSTNLSSEDRSEINNSCGNINTTTQLNLLTNKDCPYCDNHLCTITNVRQINATENKQLCVITSAIDKLRNKKNSIDAQALSKAMQKQKGILTGNQDIRTENCNIVNTDMSSSDYLSVKNCCSNVNQIKQENKIDACGLVTNVIQRNSAQNTQQCLIDANLQNEATTDSDTRLKSTVDASQSSEAITAMASMGGSLSSFIIIGAGAAFLLLGPLKKED